MRTTASPHLLTHLPVDRKSKTPLHRQIYEGLRKAILDGMLRPGQRVASTRALAAELGVSRLPVLTAYEQLLHEGYIEGRSGSGTFVCRRASSEAFGDAFRSAEMRAGFDRSA